MGELGGVALSAGCETPTAEPRHTAASSSSSAQSSGDTTDQLLHLVSRAQADFPFPSVFGAWPVLGYHTGKLTVPSVTATSGFLHLQAFTCLAAHSVLQQELMARAAEAVMAKALTGEDLDKLTLIFGSRLRSP